MVETPFPLLEQMIAANPKGGFPVPEAYSMHRERLAERGDDVDPHVRAASAAAPTSRPPIIST